MLGGFGAALGTFLLAALIIYLSYICSKYIGKGVSRTSGSKYMRLVDQMFVGQNRTLAIVQVSSRYLLLGITQEQIQVLTELEEEDLILLPAKDGKGTALDFGQLMSKLGKKKSDDRNDLGE